MKNPKLVPHFSKPKDNSSRTNILSTSYLPPPPPCYLTHILYSPHYSLCLSLPDLFTDAQTSGPWHWSILFLGCFSLSQPPGSPLTSFRSWLHGNFPRGSPSPIQSTIPLLSHNTYPPLFHFSSLPFSTNSINILFVCFPLLKQKCPQSKSLYPLYYYTAGSQNILSKQQALNKYSLNM